eukprot:jgi/Tetstr1/422853/TSEL_013644.t1
MLFRLHLKANMMAGWEEAYVAYTEVVDAIEQREPRRRGLSHAASAASAPPAASGSAAEQGSAGLLGAPLLPRATSTASLVGGDAGLRAAACARLLWAELERVDSFCTDAVHELVEATGLIYEEANHGMATPTL